ncbi:hypothetical protein GCM10027280_41720 [Micromonospora polyrhachis]|uniref:WXG100 family type VII secretion target n=1 Tax=Micromonospora polyrhachis TaxID=1282883 RepID=A0A7W7SMD0_9ACTN|nr:WXG100 family type VII secretion target [Micromonospora polyrhachis]MBB4957131.1 WXG100 family type VII secretion target [Micromonospora polyrhachis]
MAITQVTPDELNAAAKAVSNSWQKLTGIQSALNNNLQPVLYGGSWVGSAQNAFAQLHVDVNKQLTRLLESLDDLGNRVRGAGGNYESAEQENQRAFTTGVDVRGGLATRPGLG